jgi:histidinol-phosphate aminotransferase
MSPVVREAVRELTGYVPGEQLHGDGWTKLNTNENPYPPAPGVLAALQRFDPAALCRYPHPLGGELRERIAAYHGVTADQVFVANGSDEILALATRVFVPDGGTTGSFTPSYSLYPVLAAIQGTGWRETALTEDFGWREPDPEATQLFFVANPNAPTGLLFPPERIAAFAEQYGGVIIVDEAYVDFADRDCCELARTRDNVLVTRTFSKSFSLAGIRLGYAIGPVALIELLIRIKDSYNVNALTQAAGLAALADAAHMQTNAARIRATRDRVAASLAERGFHVVPSQANFVWVRPPAPAADVWLERLRTHKILVRHFPGPRTGPYLRVTIGTDPEMDRFLAAVDAVRN